jgi:hypothetical protein
MNIFKLTSKGVPDDKSHTMLVFQTSTNEQICICVFRLGWCVQWAQGLYWFGQNVPNLVFGCSCYQYLIARSRGYKWAKEGRIPSLYVFMFS